MRKDGGKRPLDLLKALGKEKLILLVAAGVVLVICSFPLNRSQNNNSGSSGTGEQNLEGDGSGQQVSSGRLDGDTYIRNLEKQLEELLGQVEGAGKVSVMVTCSATWEKILQENSQYSKTEQQETGGDGQKTNSQVSSSVDTLLWKDGDGMELPYVTKELAPVIEGAAIVAGGGDDPEVAGELTRITKALLGIEANKIWVSKMRSK